MVVERQRIRVLLGWALGLGMAMRVVVPAGFMPASIGAGWPVMACPSATAGATSPGVRQHPHGASLSTAGEADRDGVPVRGDDPARPERGERCPLGIALDAAADAPPPIDDPRAEPEHDRLPNPRLAPLEHFRTTAAARGPPGAPFSSHG